MAKLKTPIDTARAAKDGNEYHEAWVARKSLGLLLPRDGFVGIAIEGFALEDQATKEATEIADAVLYYGRNATFQDSDSMRLLVDERVLGDPGREAASEPPECKA